MEKKASTQATLHSDRKWKVIYDQDQEYLNEFKSKNFCSYKGKSYVLLPIHIIMSDYFSKSLENADNQILQLKMEYELNPEAFDATMRLIYGATDVTLENNWLLDVYSILKALSNLIYLHCSTSKGSLTFSRTIVSAETVIRSCYSFRDYTDTADLRIEGLIK